MNPIFPRVRPVSAAIDAQPVILFEVLAEDRTSLHECLEHEIAARSGLPSDEVKVVSRPRANPRVEIGGSPSTAWHVSFSHTRRRSFGALSFGRAVGVDVEWIDPAFAWEPVAAEFFPRELVETWNRRHPDEARREFFQYWVRWEAALKCRGTGFGSASRTPEAAAPGLALFNLDLDTGYAGCLVLLP
jgi:phosphopantetheinyl transferase